MPVVVMRDHFEPFLNAWNGYLSTMFLGLFRDDIDPAEDDSIDLYHDSQFSGWGRIALTNWLPAILNPDEIGQKDHDYVVFHRGYGPETDIVHGYFVVDYLGYLVMAERDPEGPVIMVAPGQTYVCRPSITLENVYAPARIGLKVIK